MVDSHHHAVQRVRGREREETITQWRAEGQTFDEIGRRLGISRQLATRIWQRAADRAPVANVRQYRASELELIDTNVRMLFEIVSNPKASFREKVEAHNSICKFSERRAKLLGLDAVVKKEVSVLTAELIKSETDRIRGRLALLASENNVDMTTLPAYTELLSVER